MKVALFAGRCVVYHPTLGGMRVALRWSAPAYVQHIAGRPVRILEAPNSWSCHQIRSYRHL